MKVKVLEVLKKEKSNKYLIERYYKELDYTEYIVCENYDFKSNTYSNGIIIQFLPIAYSTFNTFVNTGILKAKEEDSNDRELEIDN